MEPSEAWASLARVSLRLIDAGATERVAKAIDDGVLTVDSGSATRSHLAAGSANANQAIAALQELWAKDFASWDGKAVAQALRAAAGGILAERQLSPTTELVWTGPSVEGSHARATRQVIREILSGAETRLLIVGYWLVASYGGSGIVNELVGGTAKAKQRGVDVTMVLDERERKDGTDNRVELENAWPVGPSLPTLLTWRPPTAHPHAKLHAKVIVADRRDALVTSANLTMTAMEQNLEVGLRVTGDPAARIADHFARLREQGLLEPF